MNPWKLVLLGFVRHVLTIAGAWLFGHGFVPDQQAWVTSATDQAFGALLIGVALLWSAFDKKMVIDWLKRALKIDVGRFTSEAAAAARVSPLVTSTPKGTETMMLVFVLALTFNGCAALQKIIPSSNPADVEVTAKNVIAKGKQAVTISALLYDFAMKEAGEAYRIGACDEACKTTALSYANSYLDAVRPMKVEIDKGSTSFVQHYRTVYDAINQLLALLTRVGVKTRTNSLTAPELFEVVVAPQTPGGAR